MHLGAGDILLGLLGPSVLSFAVQMYRLVQVGEMYISLSESKAGLCSFESRGQRAVPTARGCIV